VRDKSPAIAAVMPPCACGRPPGNMCVYNGRHQAKLASRTPYSRQAKFITIDYAPYSEEQWLSGGAPDSKTEKPEIVSHDGQRVLLRTLVSAIYILYIHISIRPLRFPVLALHQKDK